MKRSGYEALLAENERLRHRVASLEQMVEHLTRQLEQTPAAHAYESGPDSASHPLHTQSPHSKERKSINVSEIATDVLDIALAIVQRTEQALQTSEDHYRLLADHAQDIIFRLHLIPTRACQYINPAVTSILGYTPDEYYTDPSLPTKTVHPDDRPLIEALWQSPETFDKPIILRHMHRHGHTVYLEQRHALIYNNHGQAIAIEGIARDITERMHVEQELRESQSQLQAIFDNAAVGIVVGDPQGNYLFVNQHAANSVGYTVEEFYQLPITAILHPDDIQPAMADMHAIANGTTDTYCRERRYRRKDGSYLWAYASTTAVRNEQGRVESLIAVIIDISERKQQEETLRFQANLLDMIGQAVVATDLDGKITYWNYAAETMYGWQAPEAVGREALEVLIADSSQEQATNIIARINGGKPWTGELEVKRRNNTVFPALIVGAPYYDEYGQLSGIVGLSSDISERKQLEEALRRSEQHYRTLAHNIPDAVVFLFNHELRYLVAAGKLLSVIGMTPDMLEGKTLHEAVPPEIAAIGEPLYRAILNGTAPPEIEQCYGDRVYRTQTVSLRNEQSEIIAGMIISQDITERKHIESALRESEERFRLVVTSLQEGIVIHDASGAIVSCNPSAETILGLSQDQIFERTPIDPRWHTIHEDGTPFPGGTHPAMVALRTGEAQSHIVMGIHKPDGSLTWVSINAQPLIRPNESHPYGVAASFTDITERKQWEEALLQAERFTRSILDSLPAHIAVLNKTGTILAVNNAWRTFASTRGADPDQSAEGANYLTVCDNATGQYSEEAAPFAALIRQIIASERDHATMEYPCHPHTAPPRWFTAQITRLRGTDEIHIVVSHTDITSIKQAERAIEEARDAAEAATRAKSEFLANMSHELRTPLNAILGFAQVMARSSTLPTEHREHLNIITRSGEHLLTLINNVLDLSKIEAGYTTVNESSFDLYHLLNNLRDMFRLRAQERGLSLIFDLAPNIPHSIRSDEVKLRQILINLLSNAVKFTHQGTITLHVSAKPRPQSHKETSPDNQKTPAQTKCSILRFEVADTGSGIAADKLEQIFEAFTQASGGQQAREGTGLGLAISRRFAQLLGGNMRVCSTDGEGAVFVVDILVAEVEASTIDNQADERQIVSLAPGQPAYRILVVDDRQESRRVLCKLLGSVGFELREANNGAEALAIWEPWQPHLIWMDIRMPIMNGYEATRRIKATKQGQTTVVLALTTSAFEEDRRAALEAGCDGFVSKPIRASDIFKAMGQHLGVRYRYQGDRPDPTVPENIGTTTTFTAADLARAPAEWVETLNYAARLGDMLMLEEAITQIQDEHADLAATIQHLIDTFRFDLIVEVTTTALQ